LDIIYEQINKWVDENRLLYINVVLDKKPTKTIIGRILSFNEIEKKNILIYVEDNKSVGNIKINEIDEIIQMVE
jgi:hypothetical protein